MRSSFTSTILFLSALALGGCAINTGSDISESTSESQDALNKFSTQLIGTFNYDNASTRFYNTLTLNADSTYTALLQPGCPPGRFCMSYVTKEDGTWSASNARHELKLTANLSGKTQTYNASIKFDNSQLKLTNAKGVELLNRVKTGAGIGEKCGGNINGALQCEDGLICFGKTPVGDFGGICMVPVASGESCGFRVQTAPCQGNNRCIHIGGPRDSLTCSK